MSETNLLSCILPEYKSFFLEQYNRYFGKDQFAGVLILEMESETGKYISEKCYTIGNVQKQKSIPAIGHQLFEYDKLTRYSAISSHPVLGIITKNVSKKLKIMLIPRKRYFVDDGRLSYPLTL
jgi:hypothetical protein